MATVQLHQTDNGRRISANVGDELVISLSENPTTGYRWDIEQQDVDFVELLPDTEHDAPPSDAIGSANVRRMRFRVRQSGQNTLALKQWRAWEGERSIVERYLITLSVAGQP